MAHLRADHRHHCLALVEGPSGVIASGFTVADSDALAAAETELERAGFRVRRGDPVAARSRRVREFIAFDDPFGNRLELVSQQETISPAGRVHAAGRDHRVRPPVPGRAGRARGLPVLEHPVQRAGLGLARRRRLPDPDRSRAPQAGRVPRRAARAVPHELPGGHHRRRVPELALPGRARASRSRWAPAATPSPARSSCTSWARRASPTSTRSGCAGSRTTRPGHRAPSTRTSRAPSTCGWGRCAGFPPSPAPEPSGRPRPARATRTRQHRKDRMTTTTLTAGQIDVAGVPTALIDTGDPGRGPGRPAGAPRAAAARIGAGGDRHRELAPGDPGAAARTAG